MTPSPTTQPARVQSRNGHSRPAPHHHHDLATQGAQNTPEGLASLAAMLAEAYKESESLRNELAHTRRKLEKNERVLSALQVASSSDNAQYSERTAKAIADAENRAEDAERQRDDYAARLDAVARAWTDFDRYMATAEVRLQDARASFSRILAEGAGALSAPPLPIPNQLQSSPQASRAYPAQAPSSSRNPATATSTRNSHPTSYSRYGAAHAPAPSGAPTQNASFFGNMALPPPPNIGRRPRDESLESSGAYSNGLHPNKKHRPEHEQYVHYSKPAQEVWTRWAPQDDDRGRSRRTHDSHARSTARTHQRSRSGSRSSATSLSVDEMLLEATDEAAAAASSNNNNAVYSSQQQQQQSQSQWDSQPAPHLDDARRGATHSPPVYRKRGLDARNSSPARTATTTFAANKPTVGPGTAPLTAPPAAGPLSQPGQVQTYQTHIFAPPVTGAPVKKSKSYNPPGPPGSGAAPATGAAAPLGPGGFPATNAEGQRICRQCGMPGRYKDNKCVEKWGPGPEGPGTVCDRCRKKMKRVERRGTIDQPVSGRTTVYSSLTSVLRPPISSESNETDRSVHRTDTVPLSSSHANPYPPSPPGRSLGPGGTQLVLEGPGTTTTGDSVGSSRSSRATPPSPAPPIATLENEPASPTRMLEDAIDATPHRANAAAPLGDEDDDPDAEGTDADADGDAEMDLLEAVDAAETKERSRAASVAAGADGDRWLKAEDA